MARAGYSAPCRSLRGGTVTFGADRGPRRWPGPARRAPV